jgi:hypothetical protein
MTKSNVKITCIMLCHRWLKRWVVRNNLLANISDADSARLAFPVSREYLQAKGHLDKTGKDVSLSLKSRAIPLLINLLNSRPFGSAGKCRSSAHLMRDLIFSRYNQHIS